jgi:acyl-CoA synthetase (AMP-forming)/AMP-acid ligase II
VARLLTEYRPTVLAGVPTAYRQLLDVVSAPVPSLRMCVTAGAPSDAALRGRVEALLGAPLLDCYGSTETCGMIAVESVGDSGARPVPGVRVRLVDGEIHVSGPSLMLGYHGKPDALSDGWYHTGDLGRIDADGHLSVVGRVSDVIIRGGFNVDPVEVERVLLGRWRSWCRPTSAWTGPRCCGSARRSCPRTRCRRRSCSSRRSRARHRASRDVACSARR